MIQCQGCTCAGWLWEGEGGLGDHQPGVYVPLKALFLVLFVLMFNITVHPQHFSHIKTEPLFLDIKPVFMNREDNKHFIRVIFCFAHGHNSELPL